MKKITDYAELVKAKHALNKTIAPVEDGANMAGSYTTGQQFIRDGVLYTALTSIAASTAFSSLTLDTDYEVSDDLSTQLSSVNSALTSKVEYTIISSISQIPNSDLKSLETGMYLIEPSVMNNSNLINAPFVANTAVALTVAKHTDGYMIFTCVPFDYESLPIYIGRYYLVLSTSITWIAQAKTSNPNLLDNPWFTVNQRGANSYGDKTDTTDSHMYTIDRWVVRKGQLDIQSDGSVRVYSNLHSSTGNHAQINQSIENKNFLIGKTVTVSVDIKAVNIPSDAFLVLFIAGSSVNYGVSSHIVSEHILTQTGIQSVTLTIPSDFNEDFMNIGMYVGYTSASDVSDAHYVEVRAMKLELGSVSTLAMDTAPNYATELLKCQRYFQVIAQGQRYRLAQYGGGGMINIPLPVPMRDKPTISNTTFYLRSLDLQMESVVSGQTINTEHNYSELLIILGLSTWSQDGQAYLKDGDLYLSADL